MRIGPAILIILSLVLAPLAVSDYAYAEPKYPEKYVPDRLLIKFKKDVSDNQKNKLLSDNDSSEISEIKPLGIKLIKVPEHALEKVQAAFAKNSAVEFVEKDYLFEPTVVPNDPSFPNQWHLQAINVPEAWDITKGSPIPIAILDTGVNPNHPDLKDKLINGYNWFNGNSDYSDVCGHGTAVAGSAAAITNNAIGVSGVAWENPIIPIRITDTNCYGYYSSMINGIVYAADNGARVANISFAIYNGAALSQAAQYMNDHGGWVVAAAGNSGAYEDYSENPYIISVSATGSSDTITSWSSYGPYVDFAAPGSSILTTTNSGSYGYASGTSFSSPIVAGVVALVLSSDPSMTPQDAYDAIKNSAVDKGSAGWDSMYGWGLVDVAGAVSQNSSPGDTIPPLVSILSPQDGAQVSDIFTVSVASSDNVAVNVVELYVDGSLYDQKSTQPYNFVIDAGTMSEGNHEVKAVAIDLSGNSNFDAITVNVEVNSSDSTPPSVSITDPAGGSTIEGMTTVSVDATDDVEVSSVALYVNSVLHDTKLNSPYDFTVNANDLPTGTNTLRARAYDSSNNFSDDSINVQIQANNLPASISITTPSSGQEVNGRVTITAQASNFATSPVVIFSIDGIQQSIDTSPPYESGWHTKGESTGSHTISVDAVDSAGNTASSSISVVIADKGATNEKSPGKGKKPQEDVSEILGVSLAQSEREQPILSSAVPVIDTLGPQSIAEGDMTSIDVEASDADDHGISYPADDQILPSFAVLTDNGDGTAVLDISPGFEDAGVYQVTIAAEDNNDPSEISSIVFELTVTETNRAPEIVPIESQLVAEGGMITVEVEATDADGHGISYPEDDQDLPSFAVLTDNGDGTAAIDVSPGFDDAGVYQVTIVARDDNVAPAEDTVMFELTVSETSAAPELFLINTESTNEGLNLSVPFHATDSNPDDVLSFSAMDLPSFVELADNGDRTGSLEVSPGFSDVGVYEITVTVSDNTEPEPLTDSVVFTLNVLESTPSSVITYLQNQTPLLESEEIKNLGEKVSFAAKLHVHLVGATKQERAEFQDAFHDYINEAKDVLNIGQGMNEKLLVQEILKTKQNIDLKFDKIKSQEETDAKLKKAFLLKEKKEEIVQIINEIAALDIFLKIGDEKTEKMAELQAKKNALQNEVMIEEAMQANENLSDDEINELEEKIEQQVSKSSGNDNGGGKGNNGNGGGSDKGNSGKSDKSNSDKGNSDKSNKGENGKSKK